MLETMQDSEETSTKQQKLDFEKCKVCGNWFKSILGHLGRSTKGCKDKYTSVDLAPLIRKSEEKSKEADKIWHSNRHQATYEPAKRAKVHLATYDPIKRAKDHKKRFAASTSHLVKKEIDSFHVCKGCDGIYWSILSHLNQSKDSKKKYSSYQFDKVKEEVHEWSRRKANEKRRRSYPDREKQ